MAKKVERDYNIIKAEQCVGLRKAGYTGVWGQLKQKSFIGKMMAPNVLYRNFQGDMVCVHTTKQYAKQKTFSVSKSGVDFLADMPGDNAHVFHEPPNYNGHRIIPAKELKQKLHNTIPWPGQGGNGEYYVIQYEGLTPINPPLPDSWIDLKATTWKKEK